MRVRVNCELRYSYWADIEDEAEDPITEADSADPIYHDLIRLIMEADIDTYDTELLGVIDEDGYVIYCHRRTVAVARLFCPGVFTRAIFKFEIV